jgi:hypothetical protein
MGTSWKTEPRVLLPSRYARHLPPGGRLHEQIGSFCFKVFAPLFSKSGRGLGRRPKDTAFLFGAFSFVPTWVKRKSG